MKKILVAFISFFILLIIMIALVAFFKTDVVVKENDKVQIVATLFPQYDFAKKILGDKGNVKLLLNSGVETHNFEPTAKDIITIIDNTDIFLFNGTLLEPWTEKIIDNIEKTNCKVVDVSKNIDFITIKEFEEKNINPEIIYEEHEDEVNQQIYDEHIWLSPKNAIIMIDNILEEICNLDPKNSDYYIKNAQKYKDEILKIDEQIRNIVNSSTQKEIAIGGEFAYSYFVSEYNLKFVSVYTNCGEGENPSIPRVKSVIDYINKKNIPVVYYEELSEGTVAKMIAEETETEALVLYSIHNGDTENDSYVSLMNKNIENLKKGLK